MTTKQLSKQEQVHIQRSNIITRDFGSLVGKTVLGVRPMHLEECENIGWDYDYGGYFPMVIVFTDGTALIPSSDPEGNSQGFMFLTKQS